MRRPLLTTLVGFALLVVAGCGGSDSSSADPTATASSTASTPGYGRYVAIGDSYTSAPFVYLTDVAQGCLRSNGNYPSLLAKQIGARLDDVSCSGATTTDLTRAQSTFQSTTVPAQIKAVTASTKLVTVSLGGNDSGLFGSLAEGCPITGPGGQTFPGRSGDSGRRCGEVDATTTARTVTAIGRNLVTALRAIEEKAPDARVVLVGYPRIASTTTTCPKLLPATLADARSVDAVTRELSRAMSAAAKTTGATFVDLYAASKGHDVCAGSAAWINGIDTDPQRAAPLHPFALEQKAAALAIAKALA